MTDYQFKYHEGDITRHIVENFIESDFDPANETALDLLVVDLVKGFGLELSHVEKMVGFYVYESKDEHSIKWITKIKPAFSKAVALPGVSGYLLNLSKNSVFIKIKQALHNKYELRKNSIKGLIEYRKTNNKEWLPLDDYTANTMYRQVHEFMVENYNTGATTGYNKSNFEIYIDSDETPLINPFQDYFYNLPEYKEEIDHFKQLESCVQCVNSDQQKAFSEYLKRWLVACVAQVLGKASNHTCLVFSGAQNIGKTTFFENLVFDPNYIYTGSINANDKDDKFLTTEMMLIALDELESSTRGEISHLKSLMTSKSFNLRRHYGRRKEFLQRTASFCGSINEGAFLSDMSGSRRWLVVEAVSIDLKRQKEIDLAGLWSQALSLYKSGFQYWFEKHESDKINELNREFEIERQEEVLLLKFYQQCSKDDTKARFLTTTELKLEIENKNDAIRNLNMKVLGTALKKNGFIKISKRIDGDPRKVFVVKDRSVVDIGETDYTMIGDKEDFY